MIEFEVDNETEQEYYNLDISITFIADGIEQANYIRQKISEYIFDYEDVIELKVDRLELGDTAI